jgi:hypothetical protein
MAGRNMTLEWQQAFGYRFFFAPIKSSAIDLTRVNLGGLGAGKFINDTTIQPASAKVITAGTGDTFAFGVGTKAVTNAVTTTSLATLTFDAAHGIAVGRRIVVKDLPAPFASLNGSFVVTSVTTTSPHTLSYALAGSAITTAAVAAGVVAPSLLLDGTDPPFRLMGLTNAQPANATTKESVTTYDEEAGGYATPIPTAKDKAWTLSGVTSFAASAWRAMRLCEELNLSEKLMIAYGLIGPYNGNQVEYGYGMFESYQPEQAAGTVLKYQVSLAGYGKPGLELL